MFYGCSSHYISFPALSEASCFYETYGVERRNARVEMRTSAIPNGKLYRRQARPPVSLGPARYGCDTATQRTSDGQSTGLTTTPGFQRRVQSIKREFLKRGATTPLGIPQDYWDRTEAQQRGALHAHILVWFRKRQQAKNWQALPPNPRTVSGHGPKQQSLGSVAPQPPQPHHALQHDSCYQLSEMARVSGEMVRPIVRPGDWGGYDVERLRVGALARTVLIRLKYLHICSPVYCLKERASVSFIR